MTPGAGILIIISNIFSGLSFYMKHLSPRWDFFNFSEECSPHADPFYSLFSLSLSLPSLSLLISLIRIEFDSYDTFKQQLLLSNFSVKYKVCMLTFKCLKGLAPAYLVAFCTKGLAVSGRSAVRGDLVVPSHRTDWGLRAFAVAGPSCWNELPVELRDLTVSPATFAKYLKRHLFRVGFFFW